MQNDKIIGLDISDYSIEVVEMEYDSGLEKIIAYGRVLLDPGIIQNGEIIDKKKLAQALDMVFSSAKPCPISAKRVIFGIPESKVFLHFFSVEKDIEPAKAVEREIFSVIPISEDDSAFVYQTVLGAETSNVETQNIFAAVASRRYLNEWENFFKSLKLSLVFFDIESLASFRGLFNKPFSAPLCLLDLGANTISLSCFLRGFLVHRYQMQYGGAYLTNKLANGLRIDLEQAENTKKTISFLEKEKNIAAQEILQKAFTHVGEEVKRNLDLFRKKYPEAEDFEKILLIGGCSRFEGLAEFLQEKIRLKVRAVSVFDLQYKEQGIEYLEAIGLARRNFFGYWENDLKFISQQGFFGVKGKNLSLASIELAKKNLRFLFVIILVILFFGSFIKNTNDFDLKNLPPTVPLVEQGNDTPVAPLPEPAVVEIIKKIVVKEIGVNLNVRQSADKFSAPIAQVKPGSVFLINEETNGWYKIEFEKNKFGWVFGEYVEVSR